MLSNTNTPFAHVCRDDDASRRPAAVARASSLQSGSGVPPLFPKAARCRFHSARQASSPCDATQSRPLEFGILGFGIYLGFGYWDLGFLNTHFHATPEILFPS